MDCFSYGALAWDLVSSLVTGIRHQWKGQRNMLDFRFQVKGSVFPIQNKVLDDSNMASEVGSGEGGGWGAVVAIRTESEKGMEGLFVW